MPERDCVSCVVAERRILKNLFAITVPINQRKDRPDSVKNAERGPTNRAGKNGE